MGTPTSAISFVKSFVKQSKDLSQFHKNQLRKEKVLESEVVRPIRGSAKAGHTFCSPDFYARDLPLLRRPATPGKAYDQHSVLRYKRNRPHGLCPAETNNTATMAKVQGGTF